MGQSISPKTENIQIRIRISMAININDFSSMQHNDDHVHVAFASPQRVISSAVLNGGLIEADHIVNWKVSQTSTSSQSPDRSLRDYANTQNWQGNVVGMMTAASMNSFRIERARVEGVDIAVLVTTGINNARRAGDRADMRELLAVTEEVGTINLILICSAWLTDTAMLEAMMLATEGKAAALQNAGVISPVSGQVATGTGTDAIAVVSGDGPQEISFCGKHVLVGEWIGRLVIAAIASSLAA